MPTQEEIDKKIQDGLTALDQIKSEQKGIEDGIARLNTIKAEKETELANLNGDLDSATNERAKVLAELGDINNKISAAKAELEATKLANQKAIIDGDQAITDTKARQDKILNDLKKEIATATKDKTAMEKRISSLVDKTVELTSQIDKLNGQIASLNTQITAATTVLADLNKKIASANQALADLQAKSDSISSDITVKTGRSTALDTEIAEKYTEIERLRQEIIRLEEEMKKNDTKNNDFLIARADVVEQKQTNIQRTELLKRKYGDLGEPFN